MVNLSNHVYAYSSSTKSIPKTALGVILLVISLFMTAKQIQNLCV